MMQRVPNDADEPAQRRVNVQHGYAQRHIHLDMLRGLAALAVVVGHIRGFVLLDYGDLPERALWHQPIYFLGGLGHQAVIAFFALSGFLVGGKALHDLLSRRWSLPHYMAARLARLWTVVIPALLLTLALDIAGRMLGGGVGYAGELFKILSSGPTQASPVDHSAVTFLANLAFLQTIVAPVYGSNGPLWSLANEFWYYVVFPLAAAAILAGRSVPVRVLCLLVAAVLGWLLPHDLMLLGTIWVAGAIAHLLANRERFAGVFGRPAYLALAGLALAATLASGFRWRGVHYDLVLGLVWAAALPALVMLPDVKGLYARIAGGLSEISYTLYATHFPLLAFIYFTALAPRQWAPGLPPLLIGFAMLTAALVLAATLWWCFERNTLKVRAALTSLLPKRP
jgi:peptidoglycan/LPS O-acetylase OafA/YrhL